VEESTIMSGFACISDAIEVWCTWQANSTTKR